MLSNNVADPRSSSPSETVLALDSTTERALDAGAATGAYGESTFVESWRSELLHRTWTTLRLENPKFHTVLRTHVERQDASAREKASLVAQQSGEPFTANHFRVALHRARGRFAALLRQEVAASLKQPTDQQVNDELKQLRLLQYCRVQQRRAAKCESV